MECVKEVSEKEDDADAIEFWMNIIPMISHDQIQTIDIGIKSFMNEIKSSWVNMKTLLKMSVYGENGSRWSFQIWFMKPNRGIWCINVFRNK